ncbi:MAG: hypothetical protein KGL39_35045 [Patescibacteria group bacterium]|nr:hypothetical protein [Patescibacteria group bacterium]
MTVRAKLKCTKVEHIKSHSPDETCADVEFMAVYQDGDPDNANWSKYTPSASARMWITNPLAIDQFEAGKFYFVDFTPAG